MSDWEGQGAGAGGQQLESTSEAASSEVNMISSVGLICSVARGLGRKARRAQIWGRAQDLEFGS